MAEETNGVTLGLVEDHTYTFTILNAAKTAAIDIAGWALSWMVKRRVGDADLSAILTKTTLSGIAIGGTYNSALGVNTQTAIVSIAHVDTLALKPGFYYWELKRMDFSAETTLAFGTMHLLPRVHHA